MKELKVIDYDGFKSFLIDRLNRYIYAMKEMDLDDDEFMQVGCYTAELLTLMSDIGMVKMEDILSENSVLDDILAKARS